MKTKINILALFIITFLVFGCKKKDKAEEPAPVPVVPSPLATITTVPADSITEISFVTGGNITAEGTSAITAVGVCWDINPSPTLLKPHTINGAGVGSYRSKITGLTTGTTYYVRAYATNGNGTAYGNEITVKTLTDWDLIKSGLSYYKLAVSGSSLYATSSTLIGYSSDNGATWTSIKNNLALSSIYKLVINGSNLYVGGMGGIYVSSNNGSSWSSIGLTAETVGDIMIKGSDIFVTTGSLVYRSSDNGSNWTPLSNGLSGLSLSGLGSKGSNIFVSANDGCFKSSDNGDSWVAVNTGLPNGGPYSYMGPFMTIGSDIYVGSSGPAPGTQGIYMSSNDGSSWSKIFNLYQGSSYGMTSNYTDKIYVSSSYGGINSNVIGSFIWSSMNIGLTTNTYYDVAIKGTDILALGNGSLYKYAK